MAASGMDAIGTRQVPKKSILERILYFSQIKKAAGTFSFFTAKP